MEPMEIPARAILVRKEVRQAKFMPPPPANGQALKGMEDCGTLDVLIEPRDEEHDLPRLHSWWVPDAQERRLIRQGVPIRLTVYGDGIQPMSLEVTNE